MSDHDLERLARLVTVIDHLEMHGRHTEAEPLTRERDSLLAAKPQSQPQQKRR